MALNEASSLSEKESTLDHMKKLNWLERSFTFGLPIGMLPFYTERMHGAAVRLSEKLTNTSDTILSAKPENKWSIKETIGHLIQLEAIGLVRTQEILNGVPTMSSAILELDQDYNTQSADTLLVHFKNARAKTLQQINLLGDDELLRSSIHPRFKVPMTIVDLAFFHAEHDDHHLVRMNEIIGVFDKK